MSHAYALHRAITSLAELMRQAVQSHAVLAFGAVSVANHAEPLACCDRGPARLRPEEPVLAYTEKSERPSQVPIRVLRRSQNNNKIDAS